MYKFYNQNPCHRKIQDCVCRAISLATRTPYDWVREILEENGMDFECDDLNIECYEKMLTQICGECESANGKKVKEIGEKYPDDILIIRLEGHLTCSVNGVCYDIWDCTDEKADIYWVVK